MQMNDVEKKYSELLNLIRDLSNEHIPKEYRDISFATSIVNKLTKSIWELKYCDLLQDLGNLTANTYLLLMKLGFMIQNLLRSK
jgi:hypothetical protein